MVGILNFRYMLVSLLPLHLANVFDFLCSDHAASLVHMCVYAYTVCMCVCVSASLFVCVCVFKYCLSQYDSPNCE